MTVENNEETLKTLKGEKLDIESDISELKVKLNETNKFVDALRNSISDFETRLFSLKKEIFISEFGVFKCKESKKRRKSTCKVQIRNQKLSFSEDFITQSMVSPEERKILAKLGVITD